MNSYSIKSSSKPLRIGIDARLWNETGVGRYIRNLVTHIAKIDKTNEYYLFLRRKEFESIPRPGLNFHRRLADVHWHSIQEQVLFLQILYKEDLDIVHFPYFSYPYLYNRPFIITIHDLILFHYPTGKASNLPKPLYDFKLAAYKQLMFHAAKYAKKIIAVSNATKDEIITNLHPKPEKVIVTYEGVEPSVTSPASANIPLDQPFFLYVGNAYPHKNVLYLIEAFSKFAYEIPRVNLVLVGKEDYFYAELKRNLFIHKLDKSVFFLPSVSDGELAFLYRHALALVMPSLMEGFGLPALEAMANNCLVLASNIPSLREVCQDSAIYFDPTNIANLAEILKVVYERQSEFIPNKKSGLVQAKKFSWSKMAKETVAVYQSMPSKISTKDIAKRFARAHK